jgi:DNA-binding MarR family transcriptional regulator
MDEREKIIREIIKVLPELAMSLNRDAGLHEASGAVGHRVSAAQIRALVHLAQYGRQTMGDLAEGLQITMASATGLIKPLVALGYVVRTHDDDDRRVVWVELSPQAQSMADTILAARRLEVERALAGMDDVSCRHFLEGLERLAGRQP